MAYTLIKYSTPGWSKQFDTHDQMKAYLYDWICQMCREQDDITAFSTIDDMLSTPCGCEFDVEYP